MEEEEDKLLMLANVAHWLSTKEKKRKFTSSSSSSLSLGSFQEKPSKIAKLVLTLSDHTGLKELFVVGRNHRRENKDMAGFWSNGVAKKKRTPNFRRGRAEPAPEPEPPIGRLAELRERVRAVGGADLRLAAEKPMTATDVSHKHGRLSVPNRSLKSVFLREEEANLARGEEGLRVLVVDEESREFFLKLRRWSMGNGGVINLYGDWNSVVAQNSLSADDLVQLWSFRRDSSLCFALVKGQI